MSAGGWMLNGKAVECWLFARLIRLPNGRRVPQTVQVEAHTLDHAAKRLREHPRYGAGAKWEIIDKLAPEHDVGYLGEKLPLFPAVVGTQTQN
jgi:hypothetical protein